MQRQGARVLIGAAVLLAAVAVGARSQSSQVGGWTDGGLLHAPAGSPVREILWQAPEPLRRDGGAATDEYEPRRSADGTMVVFVRNRPGHNADLYMMRWSAAGWSAPEPIESVNSPADELGPELSRDGGSLYFYSDRPGGFGGFDLWVARRDGIGWGTPTNLGPAVNTRWNEYGPALSPSGDRLYFSSNRPRVGEPPVADEAWTATVREGRTRHDYDIYSADLSSGVAGDVTALVGLNTAADEGAPAVSPAGDFLYFASDRVGGLGGFDLYRVRLADGRATGTIENLGSPVNSVASDLDPTLSSDGFRLTFSSNRPRPARKGAAAAFEAAEPADVGEYSLWTSVSREVYRDAGPSAAGLWWAAAWPWMVRLLLALIPLWLLYRLLRHERWRARFRRLSLLTQCLLLAMLIHAVIASLMTVWKVGAAIMDLAPGHGSGTRVVLSSSGTSGSLSTQLRGARVDTGGAQIPVPADATPALPAARLQSASVSMQPPASRNAAEGPPILLALSEPLPVSAAPQSALPALALDRPIATPAPAPPASVLAEPKAATAVMDKPVAAPAATALPGPNEMHVPPPPMVATPAPPAIPAADLSPAPIDSGSVAPIGATPSAPSADHAPALPAVASRSVVDEPSSTAVQPSAPFSGVSPPFDLSSSPAHIELPLVQMEGARASDRQGSPSPDPSPLHDPPIATVAPRGLAAARGLDSPLRVPAIADSGSPAEIESTLTPPPLPGLPLASAPIAKPAPTSQVLRIDPPRSTSKTASDAAAHSHSLDDNAAIVGREGPALATPSATLPALPAPASNTDLPVGIPVPIETFAQRAPESRAKLLEQMGGSNRTERAVGLALDWFLRHRSADGHWSAEHFDDGCGRCADPAEFKADAAMTGMVLLCYLGAGHTHMQDGPYREAVGTALQWMVSRQGPDGDLRCGETMYGQTVAAVALCEAFAMTRDPDLAEPARKAVAFVLARAANGHSSDERDTSVLGWLVFTVESARRAGFTVPPATFDAARTWLGSVTDPATPGAYAYEPRGRASPAMTAEAMFVQQLLGHTRAEQLMERSARYVLRTPPVWRKDAPTFYWYYATLALFQHQGEHWRQWNDQLVPQLLSHQQTDGAAAGSWEPTDRWSRMGGRVYQTAVCTLCLEVYYRYRPDQPGVAARP